MLILSTEHPHVESCRAFAHAEGLALQEVGTAREDSSFLSLQTSTTPAWLALPPQQLQAALHAWWDAPEASRASALICIGHDVDPETLASAKTRDVTPKPLLALDHNLAEREALVWSLAWGAAVPAFEGVGQARGQGLLGRARTAASALQDLRKEMRGDGAWTLETAQGQESVNHGGFVWCTAEGVPRVVREFAHQSQGHTHAQAIQWSRWTPVWNDGATSAQLRGDGALVINGQRQRMRAMDVFFLRVTAALPVEFIGRF